MKYLKTTSVLIVLFTASATVAGTCLPLTTNSSLCADPPGTISSDGFDDVCVLVACCNGGNTLTAEIPSGSVIACSDVNCTSVCNLSIARSGLGIEACNNVCNPPAAAPLEAHPAYDGGICCAVEASTRDGIDLGCSLDLGYGIAPNVGCGIEIPIPGLDIRIPSPAKFPISLTLGVAFCCGISLNAVTGDCELECSRQLGIGLSGAGCSHGSPVGNPVPCSALRGFNRISSVFPGASGFLPPPTYCFRDGCCVGANCNPNGCDPLPPPRDANGRQLCNLFPTLLEADTKCASKLFSCCDVGYCKPWCYVAIPGVSPYCE